MMMVVVTSKEWYTLTTISTAMTDNRVLQQFAQETVQGGSVPAPSSALKTTPDGSLVCMLN